MTRTTERIVKAIDKLNLKGKVAYTLKEMDAICKEAKADRFEVMQVLRHGYDYYMTEYERLEMLAMEVGTEEALERFGEYLEAHGMKFWDGIGFYGEYEGREYHLTKEWSETEDGDFEFMGWEVKWF